MTDVLGRIDNVLDQLCPCGAPPAPGSAYCGDDCTPTHIAGDTDTSDAGHYGAQSTPMRWRPDLVTASDDTNLEFVNAGRRGRYNAQIYRHLTGPGMLHLRLDDGHRFVGLDINDESEIDTVDGFEPQWQRLEQELGNSRHLEPDPDPWADVFGNGLFGRFQSWATTHAVRAGEPVTFTLDNREGRLAPGGRIFVAPLNVVAISPSGWAALGEPAESEGASGPVGLGVVPWSSSNADPIADWRSFMARTQLLTESFQMPASGIQSLMESVNRAAESLRQAFAGVSTPRPRVPEHPMLAAIEARRNRNTGPGQRPRAPRQINPHRGR